MSLIDIILLSYWNYKCKKKKERKIFPAQTAGLMIIKFGMKVVVNLD